MALTDKTGAPATVRKEADRFTVAVDGKAVGLTAYADVVDKPTLKLLESLRRG